MEKKQYFNPTIAIMNTEAEDVLTLSLMHERLYDGDRLSWKDVS